MFKNPEDYKVIQFIIGDEQYKTNYDAFTKAEQAFGEDALYRVDFWFEPLQELITGDIMDPTTFCLEWMDRQDELLSLYSSLVVKHKEIFPLLAGSPASCIIYGGNVSPAIVSREMFKKYYVPVYNEAAEVLHKHGKIIGCHFDGDCRLFARAIADTELDCVEAFTPAPDTDMKLSEARAAWPDKILWINFPSSVHVKSDADVEAKTIDLLHEVGTMDGLLMGITEDMPPDRWQQSCQAIMNGLERHADEYPELYQ
jgi:hypothetical protein